MNTLNNVNLVVRPDEMIVGCSNCGTTAQTMQRHSFAGCPICRNSFKAPSSLELKRRSEKHTKWLAELETICADIKAENEKRAV